MPNIKSAAKRLRQNEKRRNRNNFRKRRMKEAEKGFLQAVEEKNAQEAQQQLSLFCSHADRAVKRNIVSKNKAARKKSALAIKLNGIR